METAAAIDRAVCERARLARDARFDGRFFTGVLTTRIYCRPVCPANPPKPENVVFFPSAAAAGEAGFRPCLRCRPECAPGTPAWHGTSTTVRRGLRLIAEGALEDGSVERLAERLGVTGRHLRRLFHQHLGASPLAVAQTQRLHFAKRLVDDTDMPMGEIAVAAGFGSTRRFNDAFQRTYGRSPRELRRRVGGRTRLGGDASYTIELGFRPPCGWQQLTRFAASRAIPGVESVSGGIWRRTILAGGEPGVLEISRAGKRHALKVSAYGVATSQLLTVVTRLREMFDLDAPVTDIRRTLARDAVLKARLGRRPLVRVPGAWDAFELAMRAVLGQQVSVGAATTLAGRVARRYGTPLPPELGAQFSRYGLDTVFPQPAALARARFNNLGIIGSRAATMRRIAAAALSGDLAFDAAQDADEFRESFLAIRGVGPWTAEYVLMRALKYPDAFPASDLGLLRAFDGEGPRLKARELLERAEAWRPWRAYAAMLLWSTGSDSGG
jgi:AraC family transcriptional regulator of adaptative response / DNA-3-methyladenine glycosylase II